MATRNRGDTESVRLCREDGRRAPRAEPMALTERDRAIVRWVFANRLATREQVQRLFFGPAARSRCQRRLTLLYRNRYLDRLPGRAVNAPDVYYLSRRSVPGLELLRALDPDAEVTPRRIRGPLVPHTLEVGDCRAALVQACASAGYSLTTWQDERVLATRMKDSGLLPDAYFQVARPAAQGATRAGFFLEVERSGKAASALAQRLGRYGRFYYGGQYEEAFGMRALRVLVLVGSDYGIHPRRQVARLAALSDAQGVTMCRFAPLEEFLAQDPTTLLSAPIWRRPGEEAACALFEARPNE